MILIKNCKTGELYRDKWDAAEKLGISAEHVRRLAGGTRTSTNYHLCLYEDGRATPRNMVKVERNQHQRKTADTLCATCKICSCSWVQHLEPVAGWDADPVEANHSYLVKACPFFEENKRDKKFVEI